MDVDGFASARALATDKTRLGDLFGHEDLLPLWIAEPYLPLAEPVRAAIENGPAPVGTATKPDPTPSRQRFGSGWQVGTDGVAMGSPPWSVRASAHRLGS